MAAQNSIEIKEVVSRKDLKTFVEVPWSIYPNDDVFVPPLKMAVYDLLNKKKHPFYATSETCLWIALKNNKPIGRIMAIDNKYHQEYHNEKAGQIGFYECIDDLQVANMLFTTAETWLKNRGLVKVLGPINPSLNYECGLLIDGFTDSPQIMMTYNKPYFVNQFAENGYVKAMDIYAYKLTKAQKLPEKITYIAKRLQEKNNISFRPVDKKNWAREVEIMLDIYNDAWEKNWGFIPMTKDEFYHTAKDLKSIVDPDLVLFAMLNGKEVGFCVTLPDLHQVLKKIPSGNLLPFGIFKLLNMKSHVTRARTITMGVKKEYRKLGLETLLYTQSYNSVFDKNGYDEVEMSWILENNLNMNKAIITMGGDRYKTYRIFEKEL